MGQSSQAGIHGPKVSWRLLEQIAAPSVYVVVVANVVVSMVVVVAALVPVLAIGLSTGFACSLLLVNAKVRYGGVSGRYWCPLSHVSDSPAPTPLLAPSTVSTRLYLKGSATFASTSVALCRCAGRPHSLLPSVSTLPRCALCCRPRSRQSSSPPKRRVGCARGVAADRPCSAELRAPMRPCTRRLGKCFGTRTWRATTMTTTVQRVAVGAAT